MNNRPDVSSPTTDDLNLSEMLQPVGPDNILYEEDFFNWGSSIVKDSDGIYHLFYAQMKKELGFYSWMTDGVISRAVSEHPAGPYRHVETVLEGRGQPYWDAHTAHNPRIKYFEGKYYLYYISTNPDGLPLSESDMELARQQFSTEGMSEQQKEVAEKKSRELRKRFQYNQRIGVAVADEVTGPWKRLDQPLVEPGGPIGIMTCNPAVVSRPEGGYLMFIRGVQPDIEPFTRSQAIALSDGPTGPWVLQEKAAVENLNSEDPALWYDETRKRYYAVYHAFGYMGLITSIDGLNWTKANHYKVIEKTFSLADGSTVEAARLERPYIYLEDGKPKVFTMAVRETSGKTYSVFIPLG